MSRASIRKRSRGVRASVFAVMACAVALGAPAGAAAKLHCGSKLATDVKLTKDLDCSGSGNDALRIGHGNVTIDLNGYKLIGPRSGNSTAINDADGFDKLTIKDGKIVGFSYGVYTVRASVVHLSKVEIVGKGPNRGYGIYIDHGHGAHVVKTKVDHALYGLYMSTVRGLQVSDLKVTDSDSDDTYGLYSQNGTGTIDGLHADGAEYGAYIAGYSNGLTVKNSRANHAGYTGFYFDQIAPTDPFIARGDTANDAASYGFYANYPSIMGGDNKATGAGTENFHNVPN